MTDRADPPLFRAEVTEALKQRLEGRIILGHAVGNWVFASFLVLIIGTLTLWVALGKYTRTEAAPGILVTDSASTKIMALRPGVVSALAVSEGDRVEAGQQIAVIGVEQGDATGASGIATSLAAIDEQRAVLGAQQRLAGTRAQSEQARIRAALGGFSQQRADLSRQIDLQRQAIASAEEMLRRIESVAERGFVSKVEVERRRQAVIAMNQTMSQLEQQANGLTSQENQGRAELARIEADRASAVADAQSAAQTLTQQGARLRSERAYAITAPVSGRVTALQTAVGRPADPAIPLMIIVPEGSDLHADVYAPTRAIGFVKPGQEVRLLYDAFPYQRFGSFDGKVTRISRIVIDPRELSVPLKIEEAVYRIEVAPSAQTINAFGDTLPLQPGMTLTANLILDRRSFLDWLLQPLRAVLNRNQ